MNRVLVLLVLVLVLPPTVWADDPPPDRRLASQKTLNSFFPFTPPKDLESWTQRKLELREQLLVANGLWPMPAKGPLQPISTGKLLRNGVSIEKIAFPSRPGHYVTGNLYRPTLPLDKNPTARQGKLPAVLFAHGHWANGRLHKASQAEAERAVQTQAEADLDRGYFFMQAIPTQLARMGFVVFQYDMVGYADSTAIPHAAGFNDATAELWLQSAMSLQTWNSLRALDYLLSLPEVDPARVGMTGASGGGTQTFITAALDDRLAAAFPAVMVSTGMQGGCVCENCSYLRVGTGNVEFAALFAPKPLAFSCAKDWTQEFETKGFPELRQLYQLYGKPENLAVKSWLQYPHNYNQPAREFMYQWFQKHLAGIDGPVAEQPFEPTPLNELRVFTEKYPRPKDELNVAQLREALTRESQDQLAKLVPTDVASLSEYRRVSGCALRAMIGRSVPGPGEIAVMGYRADKLPGDITVHSARIGLRGGLESIPSKGLIPPGYAGTVVVWLHPKGVQGLYEGETLHPTVNAFLEQKWAVFALDPLLMGQSLKVDGKYAGYTYGYNRPLLAERVWEALLAIGNLKHNAGAKTIHLVGVGEQGPTALLAKAIARGMVQRTAADLSRDPAQVSRTDDPLMLPGLLKYGGLDGLVAVVAPDPLLVFNAPLDQPRPFLSAAYKLTKPNYLRFDAKPLAGPELVKWLAE